MTPEQQRIAIAEACGWKRAGHYWLPPNAHDPCYDRDSHGLPNYLTDLNAMHEAEKALTLPKRSFYSEWLHRLCGENHFEIYHASTAQRAEAFLRTLGKWEDAK